MLADARYEKIRNYLIENKKADTMELCRLCSVSRETIRRDLKYLENEQIIKRVHGGACLVDRPDGLTYSSFDRRALEHAAEKAAIAGKALSFIHENQSIALDSGTTNLFLARRLGDSFDHLTVVTNSDPIANVLKPCENITLIVTGGLYSREEKSYSTDLGTAIFSRIRLDTYFMSVDGISAEAGATFKRLQEMSVQQKMQEVASKTIVLTDSSKINLNSLIQMCPISAIQMIVTEKMPDPATIKAFGEKGVTFAAADES